MPMPAPFGYAKQELIVSASNNSVTSKTEALQHKQLGKGQNFAVQPEHGRNIDKMSPKMSPQIMETESDAEIEIVNLKQMLRSGTRCYEETLSCM